MDPELKSMIKENLELTQENNKILKKVRKAQVWAQISRVLYWLVIIGASVGAYYYIQPYLSKLIGIYTNGADSFDSLFLQLKK
ncbi:MAG: hypothetical protein WC795_00215 [Candidatus Paceibacterota bacterium]|jgi:hypothetical protein